MTRSIALLFVVLLQAAAAAVSAAPSGVAKSTCEHGGRACTTLPQKRDDESLLQAQRVLSKSLVQIRIRKPIMDRRDRQQRPLRVAFAMIASSGMYGSADWRSGLTVLAHSIRRAGAASRNTYEPIAIVPERVPDHEKERSAFARAGVETVFVPTPVPLEDVQTEFGRKELAKVLGADEQLKFYGAKLTDYDRVVVLDGDTMVRAPIDELMEETSSTESELPALVGVYDHELDIEGSTFPPINTGFLVYKPDKADFDAIVSIYRSGDFQPGTGWMGSGTGWTYGTGSQGLLSFYYNQVRRGQPGYDKAAAPLSRGLDLPGLNWTKQPPSSRFHPQDRSVYNVVDSKNLQLAADRGLANASRVKVFHFTGKCQKPWRRDCGGCSEICNAMRAEWLTMLDEVKDRMTDEQPAVN